MKDKLGYTLHPNQWVNYTAKTAAVMYADELCAGLTDEYSHRDGDSNKFSKTA